MSSFYLSVIFLFICFVFLGFIPLCNVNLWHTKHLLSNIFFSLSKLYTDLIHISIQERKWQCTGYCFMGQCISFFNKLRNSKTHYYLFRNTWNTLDCVSVSKKPHFITAHTNPASLNFRCHSD